MQFYTVLFGVSRAFGVAAQLIWDRALGAREYRCSCSRVCEFGLLTSMPPVQPSSAPSRTRLRRSTRSLRTSPHESAVCVGEDPAANAAPYAYAHCENMASYQNRHLRLQLAIVDRVCVISLRAMPSGCVL